MGPHRQGERDAGHGVGYGRSYSRLGVDRVRHGEVEQVARGAGADGARRRASVTTAESRHVPEPGPEPAGARVRGAGRGLAGAVREPRAGGQPGERPRPGHGLPARPRRRRGRGEPAGEAAAEPEEPEEPEEPQVPAQRRRIRPRRYGPGYGPLGEAQARPRGGHAEFLDPQAGDALAAPAREPDERQAKVEGRRSSTEASPGAEGRKTEEAR